MECPSCKDDVPDGSKFCIECGAALPVACASCGHDNLPRAKFCANCGTNLTSGAPTVWAETTSALPGPVPLASSAERRQLTVMFVDLVGSTALSARMDPEEMSEVIRGYQNCCAGEIARFAGHVAKFMGDGVLAYFGWPRAH